MRRLNTRPAAVRPMRLWVAAIALMLAIPAASTAGARDGASGSDPPAASTGGWTQLGGDAYRSHGADLDGPLDVVASFSDGFTTRALWTPPGVVALEIGENDFTGPPPGNACHLVRWTGADVSRTALPYDCTVGGNVVGFDAQRGILFITIHGRFDHSEILRGIDVETGATVWGPVGPALPAPSAPGGTTGDTHDWVAMPIALDEDAGKLYVAFVAQGGNRGNAIQRIDIDTASADWQFIVQMHNMECTAYGGLCRPPVCNDPLPCIDPYGGPAPARNPMVQAITLSDHSVGVRAYLESVGAASGATEALVWLSRDGDYVAGASGFFERVSGSDTLASAGRASQHASAQGDRFATVLADRLVYVQDESDSYQALPLDWRTAGILLADIEALAPLVVGDHTIVAGSRSGGGEMFIHDRISNDIAWWPADTGQGVYDMLSIAPTEAVLAMSGGASATTGTIFIFDVSQARATHLIPLPGAADRPELLPIPGGLLVYDRLNGDMVVMGQAIRPAPGVSVSDRYPAIGAAVLVDTQVDGAARELFIGWGDGARARALPGEPLAHEYDAPGDRILRVTAVYDDGLTATTESMVLVGTTPPLSWVEERFSPDELDTTWGVIGVLLVLLGAVVSVLARRIGRGRIADGLRELAEIRGASGAEPLAALRDLQGWHRRQEERLLRGRLTEDQFRVLEGRGGRLLRSIADALLAPVATELGAGIRKRLAASYRDGFVDPVEVKGLRDAVAGLPLPAEKRRVLESVLEAWA